MKAPTFREATDLLCMTAAQLSELFGVPVQSIRQARLDPDNRGHRPPPDGWEARLAVLAEERGESMADLARVLRLQTDPARRSGEQ